MTDHTPVVEFLGVRITSLVAGFFGGVVSLSFIQRLNKAQAFLAVITGSASAGYLTPVAVLYTPSNIPEASIAFLVGLTAMNLIPGIVLLSETFKKSPKTFINPEDLK